MSYRLIYIDLMRKRCQFINVDVDVTESRQTELYFGCLPFKQNPEILVGNFRSARTVRVVYHLPKISGLSRRARLDSSYNMKLVRNSRNL